MTVAFDTSSSPASFDHVGVEICGPNMQALLLWRCHAEKFDAVNIITVIRRVVLHLGGESDDVH